MKSRMLGTAGRWAMICSVSKEGEGDEETAGGGGNEPSLEDLQKRLDALEGMKDKAVNESKSEREKRKAMEAKISEYEAEKKEREEAEAKKRGEFEKLAETAKAEKDALAKKLESKTKAAGLKDGLAAVNIAPQFRKAVESMFRDQVSLEGEDAKIDGKDPAEFFKAWANSDEGKAFTISGSSGGGAGGGSGGGSDDVMAEYKTASGQPNLTKLGALKRSDPAKYKTLAKQLGLVV